MSTPEPLPVFSPGDGLSATLAEMDRLYKADRDNAIRGQHFIKTLHGFVARQLRDRLHPAAMRAGVRVVEEASVFGSHKAKDVDVAVIHPTSGPLVLVGARSQMSSIGNNVLNYYQDIVGEAVSLEERYPMTVHSYVYLHPRRFTRSKSNDSVVETDYARYAKMYRAITGRDDVLYKNVSGVYDQFAYLVVDFEADPIQLCDDLVAAAVPDVDLSIRTFVDRVVETYQRRNIWFDLFV
ncbi:hypothetical protein ACIB24_03015 [Spongisporangium articulatum]|uniref:Uncharacterized protein n=1 Tax=Spongisporangium articulatum TaxID=3362603 RepID=A0ABW8AI31_9ACTN